MISVGLSLAATDPRLRPVAVRAYVVLHIELDYVQYRPIKRWRLARRAQTDERQTRRAVSQLLGAGYLERGPDTGSRGRQLRTYRLVGNPPEPPAGMPRSPLQAT